MFYKNSNQRLLSNLLAILVIYLQLIDNQKIWLELGPHERWCRVQKDGGSTIGHTKIPMKSRFQGVCRLDYYQLYTTSIRLKDLWQPYIQHTSLRFQLPTFFPHCPWVISSMRMHPTTVITTLTNLVAPENLRLFERHIHTSTIVIYTLHWRPAVHFRT